MKKVILVASIMILSASILFSVDKQLQSFQLNDQQLAKLVTLIKINPDAKKLFDKIKRDADGSLDSTPYPIAAIRSEGLLNSNPLKKETQKSLKDMEKIYALCVAYIVMKDDRYLDKAKEYFFAWAYTNKGRGDPIDDTNLEPVVRGYDLVKGSFTAEERTRVEKWFSNVADAEIARHNKSRNKDTGYNNWNSHCLKVVGLIAFATGNKDYLDYTLNDYREQITRDLRSDGSSFDFHERDALHYHLYTLEPLLSLCIAAKQNGYDLYNYESPEGNSLKKSVAFTMPYVTGEKTHNEYVNSKVKFDRERAAAGQKEFETGREFEPKQAALMLNEYYFFDHSVLTLVQKVSDTKSAYPSWMILVESVQGEK